MNQNNSQSKHKVSLNWFSLNPQFLKNITEECYKYRLRKIVENRNTYYREIWRKKGVNLEEEAHIFVSLEKLDDPECEKKGTIIFSELPSFLQEKLIQREIQEKKLFRRINRRLKNVKGVKEIGKFLFFPYVRVEIIKHKNNFYLVLLPKTRVRSSQNLWDLVKNNKKRLQKFVGRDIENLFHLESGAATIKHITENNKKDIDDIIQYHKSKDLVENKKEITQKVGEINYNQPILNAGKEHWTKPYLPQFSRVIFSLDDVNKKVRKKIRNYWYMSNKEKRNLLKKATTPFSQYVSTSPLKIDPLRFKLPELIVKTKSGETTLNKTNRLFSWIQQENIQTYLPYEIPAFLQNESIPTFILIDNKIDSEQTNGIFNFFGNKYNKVRKNTSLPYFNFKGKVYPFSKDNLESCLKKVRETFSKERNPIGFAFIIGKKKYEKKDYYEDLKMQLFQLDIISQNILIETLGNPYAMNNLLLQIMGKLGIKYFVLHRKVPYDYIIGVDIGKHKKGGYRIGGCTVVFDSSGRIRRIQPVKAPASGETMDLTYVFKYLANRTDLTLKNKNMLVLMDGNIYEKEKEGIKRISEKYLMKITFMNVIKNNKHVFLTDNQGQIGFIDNIGLLQPHTLKGARPIKIEDKIIFKHGTLEKAPLRKTDLQLLFDLTRLNYSTLFSEKKSLKLPAPVHYADQFVKALGKEWKIHERFLKQGFLYFL